MKKLLFYLFFLLLFSCQKDDYSGRDEISINDETFACKTFGVDASNFAEGTGDLHFHYLLKDGYVTKIITLSNIPLRKGVYQPKDDSKVGREIISAFYVEIRTDAEVTGAHYAVVEGAKDNHVTIDNYTGRNCAIGSFQLKLYALKKQKVSDPDTLTVKSDYFKIKIK